MGLFMATHVVLVALLAALLVVLGLLTLPQLGRFIARLRHRRDSFWQFRGGVLLRAGGDALTHQPPPMADGDNDLARLIHALRPRFPDLGPHLDRLADPGQMVFTAPDGPTRLVARLRAGILTLTLTPQGAGAAATPPGDGVAANRMAASAPPCTEDEAVNLRAALAHAPMLVWRQDDLGRITWANQAYVTQLAARLPAGDDLEWPLPPLFASTDAKGRPHAPLRQRPMGPEDGGWYDITQVAQSGGGALCFALPADAAVQAEQALQDFVQTLTKTFAHLPIGLAVFDRNRKLALFNPALTDLTGLPIDLLSMRPTLTAVLDAMRDRHMLPEPRDYRAWRAQVAAMEQAVDAGNLDETWSLPGGQTYRVTSRPHANGAMALMIEDISTEVIRTRRYRADLELGQSVIDAMAEGVAVFSASGVMVMSNRAYTELWGHDPVEGVVDLGIGQIARHWRALTSPGPLWAEVEEHTSALGPRDTFQGETRLLDGRLLQCRVVPLAGGATMVAFRRDTGDLGQRPSLIRA